MDSHALWLRLGKRHWMLLPDRQALWAWQASREPLPERLWLGFRPGAREHRELLAQAPSLVWLSGAPFSAATVARRLARQWGPWILQA
jgi:competence protein ComEC